MLGKIKSLISLLIVCVSMNLSAVNLVQANTSELSDAKSAKDVVLNFQNVLLDVMKQGEKLSFEQRCDLLKADIVKSHDVLKSLRTIVGSKQWKNFSVEQKQLLTDVFTRFIVTTYASNFDSYDEESFEFVSEQTTKKGNVIIRSILQIPQGKRKKVVFDYALKKRSGDWKIFNIAADGVSDLATRRSEYRRILEKEDGFNTLIAIINEKIDNYAKQ